MSSPKPILFTSILLILGWALAGCRGTTSDAGPTAANTGGTAGEGAAGGSGTQIVTGPCDNYDGTPSELADLQGDAAITIDFAGSRAPLEHFWRATGFTPASQLQDKSMVQTQQRLGTVHQNGTLYTRPHYLLNLITMGELGTASYDFSKLDTALDVLVQNDQRLIFEVMGNPSERFTNFESDAQVRAFKALVVAMVTHLIERYGSEVVRSWYFEVWNEPEASLFWPYSTQGLLNYYDAVSEALLEVDPTLKWGGPGTSGSLPAQLKAVLAHCDTGTNYFTGENGVRIDFISVHVKDLPHRAAERMRDYHSYIADNHPRLADTPFINDEADPMIGWHRSFWWRGHPWYAAYVAQSAHVHLDHVVDPLGIESPIQSNDNGFIGGWGQRTQFTRYYRYNGFSLIKKPVQSVLSLMALLGNQRLTEVNLPSPYDQHLGLLATTRGDESVALLAYHRPDIGNYQEATYPEITNHDAAPVSLVVDLENLPVKAGRIVHFRLDEQHGNPYQAFLAEGAPENPTSEQIALMRAQQEPVVLETPKDYLACDGRVRLKIELPPSSVSVIMLAKQAPVLPRVENLTVTQYWGFAGQREMLLTWSNVDSRTLLSYEVLHTPADGGESRRVNAQDLLDASYTLVDPEPGQYQVRAVDFWGKAGELSVALSL